MPSCSPKRSPIHRLLHHLRPHQQLYQLRNRQHLLEPLRYLDLDLDRVVDREHDPAGWAAREERFEVLSLVHLLGPRRLLDPDLVLGLLDLR
jgi:hypothetical protein